MESERSGGSPGLWRYRIWSCRGRAWKEFDFRELEIVSGGFESKEFWKELYLIDRLVFFALAPQTIRITGIAGTFMKVIFVVEVKRAVNQPPWIAALAERQ